MTPGERLETAARLSDEVRTLTEAGVRRRQPALAPHDVELEVRAILTRALARSARPPRGWQPATS
jgi:hypothetical protein